jgi:uncharacterized SAM-binding protein YcdF (DUF218 family)
VTADRIAEHEDEHMTRRRRVAFGAAGLAFVVAGAAVAAMWPRSDVPRDPDAVVVLGGAGFERAELGIELAERYGAMLVLSSSAINFGRERGADCQHDPTILCSYPQPATTAGEARTVAALVEERGWDHVTVATSDFHTTRARVLFRQCLGDRVTVVGARPSANWARGLPTYAAEAAATLAALTTRRAC